MYIKCACVDMPKDMWSLSVKSLGIKDHLVTKTSGTKKHYDILTYWCQSAS